jgi:hypothetical protein
MKRLFMFLYMFVMVLPLSWHGVAMADAFGGYNGTIATNDRQSIEPHTGTPIYYFNATTANNNTDITATINFFEWCNKCKFWVEPNPTYNSTAEAQSWTNPASGTIYFGDITRNMSRNQTVSGSISIASPVSAVLNGPVKSWIFDVENVADNRTITIHGSCWRE